MNKQEQIAAKLSKPIEIGDKVRVSIPYNKKETKKEKIGKKNIFTEVLVERIFKTEGNVVQITNDKIKIGLYGSQSIPIELQNVLSVNYDYTNKFDKFILVDSQLVKPTTYECGVNPFSKEKNRINFFNQELSSLLYRIGFDDDGGGLIEKERTNFDPFVIDANGEAKYYQRGLVWTLEQKQLLLESIYNGIEIGKFLFRYNSWERIHKNLPLTGKAYSFDCVDGKQRLMTIIQFLKNEFPDSRGNYFKDLSDIAVKRLMRFANLSYGEIGENASDEDVIDIFLTLNFTGTPMSKEHIEYVKSINLNRK